MSWVHQVMVCILIDNAAGTLSRVLLLCCVGRGTRRGGAFGFVVGGSRVACCGAGDGRAANQNQDVVLWPTN